MLLLAAHRTQTSGRKMNTITDMRCGHESDLHQHCRDKYFILCGLFTNTAVCPRSGKTMEERHAKGLKCKQRTHLHRFCGGEKKKSMFIELPTFQYLINIGINQWASFMTHSYAQTRDRKWHTRSARLDVSLGLSFHCFHKKWALQRQFILVSLSGPYRSRAANVTFSVGTFSSLSLGIYVTMWVLSSLQCTIMSRFLSIFWCILSTRRWFGHRIRRIGILFFFLHVLTWFNTVIKTVWVELFGIYL